MKNLFRLMAAFAACIACVACGGSAAKSSDTTVEVDTMTTSTESKTLVAYYSATGTTAKAAEELAKATDATLYEIVPEQIYTDEDLDYQNKKSRSSVENQNPDMRPAIKTGLDIAHYDTIYIGFPVWWDKAPLVVYTFLDSYDFNGKEIVIFATAHSSGLNPSFEALKAAYPDLKLTEGQILNVSTADSFKDWVNSLK